VTLATRLALLEAQTKASRQTEDAIRRARFRTAKGLRPGETMLMPSELPETYTGVGARMDQAAGGYGPIYRAYRELKILHD
jgi:hypothetical protein